MTQRVGASARRQRTAADTKKATAAEPGLVPAQVQAELIRRVREIEATYRDAAQKMGQLYMYADQHQLAMLTRDLDRPMRNASENECAMVSILDELQLTAVRRHSGPN